MKIKAIGKLCRDAGTMELTTGEGVQWAIFSGAMYPLEGMARMTNLQFLAAIDTGEGKATVYNVPNVPETVSTEDEVKGEEPTDPVGIKLMWLGRRFIVFDCGLMVDAKYIEPFSDYENGVTFWKRSTAVEMGGKRVSFPYIAVKAGMFLKGILTPYRPTEDMVDTFRELERSFNSII